MVAVCHDALHDAPPTRDAPRLVNAGQRVVTEPAVEYTAISPSTIVRTAPPRLLLDNIRTAPPRQRPEIAPSHTSDADLAEPSQSSSSGAAVDNDTQRGLKQLGVVVRHRTKPLRSWLPAAFFAPARLWCKAPRMCDDSDGLDELQECAARRFGRL